MHSLDSLSSLTPLQRAIYDTDQLGVSLRDSTKIVTARMGFFVGQHKYLQERARIAAIIGDGGVPEGGLNPTAQPRGTSHQIGSP